MSVHVYVSAFVESTLIKIIINTIAITFTSNSFRQDIKPEVLIPTICPLIKLLTLKWN
jgi:hypothetical protein